MHYITILIDRTNLSRSQESRQEIQHMSDLRYYDPSRYSIDYDHNSYPLWLPTYIRIYIDKITGYYNTMHTHTQIYIQIGIP